jgi:hypothetical protein
LVAKNVKERLEFAKMHKDWKMVVFNEETKINRLHFEGISWCWIRDKKNLLECAIK